MERFWKSVLGSFICFILFDYLWIGVIYKSKYSEMITAVQGVDINFKYSSSIMVYLMMTLVLVVWVLPKLDEQEDKSDTELLKSSFKYGGLMGIMIYSIYNFTNYAVFQNWSLETSLVDIFWGGFLMSIVTYISYAISYEETNFNEKSENILK